MGSAGLRMMRNLEITAKLQTATMELVPNGPTTCTRYVCKVGVNYVSSADLAVVQDHALTLQRNNIL